MVSELKNKLKETRQGAGYTQESLAEKVGVTRQTIISVEKGVYAPSVTLAIFLAKALHKSVEEIFYTNKK